MAVLYDARGNPINVNFPDSVTNETITDARPITAVLAANNAEVLMDLNGANTAIFEVRTGAGALSYVFEGTVDGTNYTGLPALPLLNTIIAAVAPEIYVNTVVITTTHAGLFMVDCAGLRRIRLRVSAYTSGNITVAARATPADAITYAKPIPSVLHVTATAAVNTASTATLPAATGLFHYITRIHLIKLYSVVGVAAGAGVIVTSTNLPGSPAWTTEQAAKPAGDAIKVIDEFYSGNPLKSSAAGVATTLVAPASLQTIWRWNVSYYVGA